MGLVGISRLEKFVESGGARFGSLGKSSRVISEGEETVKVASWGYRNKRSVLVWV